METFFDRLIVWGLAISIAVPVVLNIAPIAQLVVAAT